MSSEELARRAQQGCRASFAALIHRYAPRLQAFLRRRTGDHHDAEDLVQDTFVKAYQNLGRYRTHRRFSTWLFTIASREAVSHHRRWRPSLSPPEVSVVTPETIAEDRERSEGIWSQAAALPEGQYRALWLRYAEDMSVKEIARALGKSTVCVKVLLYRARRALADQWNERVDATAANAQNREEHLNSGEAQ